MDPRDTRRRDGNENPTEGRIESPTLQPGGAGDATAIRKGMPVELVGGRYRLRELLGRGGMGVVYRADDLELGEEVALKILAGAAAQDPQARDRFKREIVTARKITHLNVVRIHDFGSAGDDTYISMELLEGGTLAKRIDAGPLAPDTAVAIAVAVCSALSAAHRHDIVHRDLKPENILFDSVGTPKLADFGLARITTASHATVGFTGTPHYMSPEQASGGDITSASDLYSLGVVLYEMLTGRLPFEADNLVKLAMLHANERPVSLRSVRLDVPLVLEAIALRLLEKDPAKRYPSADALSAVLRGWKRAALPTSPHGGDVSVPPRRSRALPLTLAGAALVVAGVVAGVVWVFGVGPFAPVIALPTPTPVAAVATAEPVATATPEAVAPPSVAAVLATPYVTPRLAKAPLKLGSVTVTAKPWVAVWIDGKSVREETPLQRHELSAGKHEFRFVHRTKVITRSVVIAPNQETRLFVDVEAGTVGPPPG